MGLLRLFSVLSMKIDAKALSILRIKSKVSKCLEMNLLMFVLMMSIPEVHSSLVKQLNKMGLSLNS